MSGKVEYGASVTTLEKIRTQLLQGGSLHAFVSNHAYNAADVAATYNAIEATFGGYAAITCNSWGAAFLNALNIAETDEIVRSWTTTGSGLPQSVYGIYYLDAAGNLLFSELFSTGPVVLSFVGDQCNYQPIYTALSRF